MPKRGDLELMGHKFKGFVKTLQKLPKAYLQGTMKAYHGVSHLFMGPVNNGNNSYYLGFNYYLSKVLSLFLILIQDGCCPRKHIRPCGMIVTVMFVFGLSLDLKSFLIYFIVAMLFLCMIMQSHCCLVLENIWVIK